MAIAYRATGTKAEAASDNISVAMPTGTVENDIMILVVCTHDNVAVTLPAGWAIWDEQNASTGMRGTVAWKRAANGEAGPYTITHASGNSIIGGIVSFSGCITTGDPADTLLGTPGTSATTITANQITPSAAGEEIIFAASHNNNSAVVDALFSAWSGTDPTFTERMDYTTVLGLDAGIGLAHGNKSDTTATGNRTVTISPSGTQTDGNLGWLIALKPVAAATSITPAIGSLSASGVASWNDRGIFVPTEVDI